MYATANDYQQYPTPNINPPPPPPVHSQFSDDNKQLTQDENQQNATNMLPVNDKFHSLIMTKERELHDINEYRMNTLQSLLNEKEGIAQNLQQKFTQLKSDFNFNMKLIEDRDRELDRYEGVIKQLQEKIVELGEDLGRKDGELVERVSENKAEVARSQEQDNFWKGKVKESRDEVDRLRWEGEESRRR